MKKIYLTIIICFLLFGKQSMSQNIITENFDDLTTMFASGGWVQQNNSVPLGPEIWYNGSLVGLPAYNGAADSYAEASYQSTSTTANGNISNWMITPSITLNNGDVISFYTTSYNNSNFPDRLELRMNPLNTTNVGSTDTSLGDFTVLLLEINPTLSTDSSEYPQGFWGQFVVPVSGLSGPTSVRLAFRYDVTDGGQTGANSSTIGIDAFSVDMPVGISEAADAINFSVYPNPVSDRLTVSFIEPLKDNGNITIFNSIGQSVSQFKVSKGDTRANFDISSLSNGSYSLVVNTTGSVSKKNFLKN